MVARTLGIDIGDGYLAGVVLERQRRTTALLAWCCLPLPEGSDQAAAIGQLCERLEWDGDVCLCGLPLSLLSIRNVELPFSDVKKITQALPFELEEQLLAPLDSLVYDYCLGRKNGSHSQLVVFAADQELLAALLEGIAPRLDPDRILPAMVPLVEQCTLNRPDREPFLLAHAGLHSVSIALVVAGKPVLFRRLSYPEQMIAHSPFILEGDHLHAESPAAGEWVRLLARMIEQSLDFFRMENKDGPHPASVVLSGPLAGMDDALVAVMGAALHLPVEPLHLLEAANVVCTEEQRAQWHGSQMNRALALALSGKKKSGFNLRKHHLAKKVSLLSRRKPLILTIIATGCLLLSGLAYIGFDTYALRQRDKQLAMEMRSLYKATFPGVSRIQDPYIEMQAKLKSLQGTETPLPYFVADRWVLPLLADISRRLPASLALKVGRLSLDREGVAMKGNIDSFNGVELMKTALAGSPRLGAVRIVSATADKGKKDGSIRFELQMQLEGM